jgi:HK97 family phage portal protein
LGLLNRLRGVFQPQTRGNGTALATKASGVTFVGSSGAARLWSIFENVGVAPDDLTRGTAYIASVYIYAAIQYRSENLSEPPARVVQVTDDGQEEPLPDHPVSILLESPSPDYSFMDLVDLTSKFWDIDGRALWLKRRPGVSVNGRGAIRELEPFSGNEFSIEPTPDRLFGRFRLHNLQGETGQRTVPAEDVVLYRFTNPYHRTQSVSPTDTALNWAGIGGEVRETVKSILQKAIFTPGVFSYPTTAVPTELERERNEAQIRAKYTGGGNRGVPIILEGGITYESIPIQIEQMLPSEVMGRVEANVAAAFGIAPVVLGYLAGLENSPWSQMSEARRMTYEDTLDPMWRRYETAMDRQLLTPDDMRRGLRIRFDRSKVRALQKDLQRLAETAAKLATFWTVDELRALTDKPPLEEGQEVAAPPQTPILQSGPNDVVTKSIEWLKFDLEAKAQESGWTSVIGNELKSQGAEIERLARELLEEIDGAITEASAAAFLTRAREFLDGDAFRRLEAAVRPLVAATAGAAMTRAAVSLDLTLSVVEDSLIGYAELRAAELAGLMGKTTATRIVKAAERTIEQRGTVAEFAKALTPTFGRPRAFLVARTETTLNANRGPRVALVDYQATQGVQITKSWLTSQDERVRPEHVELEGETVPVDQVFSNGLQEPSEPNCRCTLTYAIVGA